MAHVPATPQAAAGPHLDGKHDGEDVGPAEDGGDAHGGDDPEWAGGGGVDGLLAAREGARHVAVGDKLKRGATGGGVAMPCAGGAG